MRTAILARRIIQDAREYSSVILRLLQNTEEQHELAVDARWEEELGRDPYRRILHKIPMPAHMQSIAVERTIICVELKHGPLDEEHMHTRLVRIMTLQLCLADWLIEELLKRRDLCMYLRGRDYIFGVGAQWNMLIVEKLPKLFPKPR